MFNALQHRGWHYAVLLTAGAALFLVNLGGASLWDLDEGKNAECAWEMLVGKNFIVPFFNSDLRADKPALLYWLQALAYVLFGVNEFSARLPSALAGLATILLCYELGRSLFGKTTGFLAGLIVGATPMLCGAARFANPDALLNLCIVLTMFFFWHCQRGDAWQFIGIGVACGLAVLAKGPVGLVLPFAISLIYCVWTRQLRIFLHPGFGLAALCFLLVALPWYILVGTETHGKFLRGFLLEHNIDRFSATMENHRGNVLYYPLVMLLGTAPWSIFLGPALLHAYRQLRMPWRPVCSRSESSDRLQTGPHQAMRFLTVWIGVFVLFFSLAATKLPNYILPVCVPLALILANFLVCWVRGEVKIPAWMLHVGLGFLLLTGVGVSVGLLVASGIWPVSWLRGRSYPGLEQGAIIGVLPLIGALVCWWFLRQERRKALVWTMTLTSLAFVFPLAVWGGSAWNDFKAPRPLVELAHARRTTEDVAIACWHVEHIPSLVFYLGRDVTYCKSEDELLGFLDYPKPVYLFLPLRDWETHRSKASTSHRELARHYDMYHHEELVVITNR